MAFQGPVRGYEGITSIPFYTLTVPAGNRGLCRGQIPQYQPYTMHSQPDSTSALPPRMQVPRKSPGQVHLVTGTGSNTQHPI